MHVIWHQQKKTIWVGKTYLHVTVNKDKNSTYVEI